MIATGAHFGLAFAAPPAIALSSPQPLSRRFMMQKVRSQAFRLRGIALELLVGMRFQVFSLPSPGCFSPFPRGTCSLSVSREYLGL